MTPSSSRLGLISLIVAAAASGLGCSSDDTAVNPVDAGPGDATADQFAADGGGDAHPGDATATDAPATDGTVADGSSDGSSDATALTPLQARGAYLVNSVIGCSDCHTPQGPTGPDMTKFLAGNPGFVTLPNGDKLGSRNLTNDATGLKNRTDAEIKAMFMDGKRPAATGTEALNPVMPYYVFHNMTSADGDAIVAYLRTVPAVVNTIPQRAAAFDLPAPANYLNVATLPAPAADFPQKDSALRGAYLANQSGVCIECHTPHNPAGTADVLNTAKYYWGGEDFSDLFAATLRIHPVSKNLTSDNATGLGTWSVDDIVNAVTKGKSKDGTGICPPMPTADYATLTASDATDIANYIHSIAPQTSNIVDQCVFPPAAPPADGGSDAAHD